MKMIIPAASLTLSAVITVADAFFIANTYKSVSLFDRLKLFFAGLFPNSAATGTFTMPKILAFIAEMLVFGLVFWGLGLGLKL